jgi:hypothetical protein
MSITENGNISLVKILRGTMLEIILVNCETNTYSPSLLRYNRQFRYEERDDSGFVKGRYGFFDRNGKLQVVNYTADPKTGFHAEGDRVPSYPH